MFLNFDTGKNTYKCVLTATALCDIEDDLGCNPINIFVLGENELPKLKDMLCILYHSIKQFNHGIKKSDIYDIFDEYVENGGSFTSLMTFLVNLFQESKFMKVNDEDKETTETEGKN